MRPGHDRRNKEEDTVHDPKRKARFQHAALFIRAKMQPIHIHASQDPETYLIRVAAGNVRAVLVGDAAKLVHASDESADE